MEIQHRVARFRKVNDGVHHTHHDALEFPDGKIVLVHDLAAGQEARVLQLPAEPIAEHQPESEQVGMLEEVM